MRWPDLFVNRKVQEHEQAIPDLVRRIEALEAEVQRLEAEKAAKKGRKPTAGRTAG